jgi:hypothetical protein
MAIEKSEIQRVLKVGIILFHKSQRNKRPCPVYTLQGPWKKRASIRLIIEQCRDETIVLECYIPTEKRECLCN